MKSRRRAELSLVITFMLTCTVYLRNTKYDNNNNNNEENENYGNGNGIGLAVMNSLDKFENENRFAFII